MQLNKELFQKTNTFVNQTEPSFGKLFDLNNLKAELQAKDTTIKKLKAHIKRVSETSTSESVKKDFDEIETINIELEHRMTRLIAKNEHLKQMYKQLSDSIKPSREKVFVITTLKNNLRKLKRKDVVDNGSQMSNATTIAPGMYKLDPIILAPQVKNNTKTHEYYLKHTTKQAARSKPSTSASGSKTSCNTKNDRISQTPSSNEKNKVEVQSRKVKFKLNKQNSDSKNVYNEHVKHHVKGAQDICYVCNECLFDANHAMCLIDHVNSMNARDQSTSKKNKNRKEWEPTGKVFNSIGYKWKPTRRTFTLVGNADHSQLTNFVHKFLGTVKFGNDQVAKIIGYGVDLLLGSRRNNMYSLSIREMMVSSPVCLLSKATKTKSWLRRRRLSHLKFGALNHLARNNLVRGLPKFKFKKDHLYSAYAMGKRKKQSYKLKSEDTKQEKLYLLYMDLGGPMRVAIWEK
nr:hypothetical protein [Tanacetum cinerariifolium]